MAISDFFTKNIRTEEMLIKKNKDALMGVSTLEVLMGGAMVLGSLAGIFTIPTLLAVSIPGLIGLTTINEVKKNIKDSRTRIKALKNMEEQGVSASRNHERNRRIEELTEEKSKEEKKNDKFAKLMLGGIAAFAIGGFAPIAAAVAAPLMFCGYGTMAYGLFKASKAAAKGREIQNKIDRLKDAVAVSNINPRFVTTADDDVEEELKEEKKPEKKVEKKPVKKSRKEAMIDEYIENMSKQLTEEEENHKTK